MSFGGGDGATDGEGDGAGGAGTPDAGATGLLFAGFMAGVITGIGDDDGDGDD